MNLMIFCWLLNTTGMSQLKVINTGRGIARSKHDGTRAETRFGLSAKRTSPLKSAGGVSSVDYWQSRSADQRTAIV